MQLPHQRLSLFRVLPPPAATAAHGIVAGAALLSCWLLVAHAFLANGAYCFPLDDPWIHLQFAQNLHEFGRFSYYQGQAVTSGSTAPLYTLLLAAGFSVIHNEMLLSYMLGIVFLLLGGFCFSSWVRRLALTAEMPAVLCLALYLFEPHLQWAAVSGMETTLFLFLLVCTFHCYQDKRPLALGISAGLLLWTRPETLLLIPCIAADRLLNLSHAFRSQTDGKAARATSISWLKAPAILFVLLLGSYFVFNFALSGSAFPNTMAAKVKYYAGTNPDFPAQVLAYLFNGPDRLLTLLACLGALRTIAQAVRRQSAPLLVALLWSVGLFLAYWSCLPYAFQNGRYLMPLLPCISALGLYGLEWCCVWLGQIPLVQGSKVSQTIARSCPILILACLVLEFGNYDLQQEDAYSGSCRAILNRQVAAAAWIEQHLSPAAVIATHDVGAIAYYSRRHVIDMVGLVSPDLIGTIHNNQALKAALLNKGATHLAVLDDWFRLTNTLPVFDARDGNSSLLIYPLRKNSTFASRREVQLLHLAEERSDSGKLADALQTFSQISSFDQASALAHLGAGRTLMHMGRIADAQVELRRAAQLQTSFSPASFWLGLSLAVGHNPQAAIAVLEHLLGDDPEYCDAYGVLARIYSRDIGDKNRATHCEFAYRKCKQQQDHLLHFQWPVTLLSLSAKRCN